MTEISFFKRLSLRYQAQKFAKKDRKKNPDWARVEEPDEIMRPALISIFGMMIAGFSMLMTWYVMTASPIVWIASFLASLHSPLPFPQLYAVFASALIAMVDMVVTVIFVMFGTAGNDDVIEMISDLDSNIQERIVELEDGLNQKIDAIKNEL